MLCDSLSVLQYPKEGCKFFLKKENYLTGKFVIARYYVQFTWPFFGDYYVDGGAPGKPLQIFSFYR